MDISKILTQLKGERAEIEEAITSLELLAHGRGRKRGGSRGSNDPGSQPPPAAPAAARIASRLDRAISWKKPA